MTWRFAQAGLLFAVVMIAAQMLLAMPAASASTNPADPANSVRTAPFDVQRYLVQDDGTRAADSLATVSASVDSLLALANPATNQIEAIDKALADAGVAVENGDSAAFALASGRLWSHLLAVSYEETVSSISAGNVESALAWSLVRDYRQASRLSHGRAGATEVLHAWANTEFTQEEALALVQADLLDTYQAQLHTVLAELQLASQQQLNARAAESAGLAEGYWSMLAPVFEQQFGAEPRAAIDTQIQQLEENVLGGDIKEAAAIARSMTTSLQDFRAASLSADDLQRRAGEALLYLSLVGVEYGRGVKNGEVVVDIEVQEAKSFLAGAHDAYLELRPTLVEIDRTTTDEAGVIFASLQQQLNDTSLGLAVTPSDDIDDSVASATTLLHSLFPDQWERTGGDADFGVISALLDQMEKAVAAKQPKAAESARMQAYAIFDSGAEKRLLAFSPSLAQQIELLFWQGTGDHEGLYSLLDSGAGSQKIRPTRLALDDSLQAAQLQLGEASSADGTVIFNSATIVFREGLEAVLILVSLTASMIGAHRLYKRPLTIGAIAALITTIVLFFLAQTVLLNLNRQAEKVEAVISVLAVGVLLLVMNWFFHKVYWTRWIAGHHARRREVIGGAAGQTIGLIALGFTSVFREGAETVLFLQALVLDAGTMVVLQGTLLGLAGVAVVGVLVLYFQRKLPHKKMLMATGLLLAMVLVTMVGNTVHVLQVVGWAPITPIGDLRTPYWAGVWFGVFPTWEGVLAQAAAVVLVIGSYFLATHQQHRAQARMTANLASHPTAITEG